MNKHIICITPLRHLSKSFSLLKKKGKITYDPNITKSLLKKKLQKDKSINCIFCNPNMQNFILDYDLLNNTGIKIINTASTGTNHIDLDVCKKLGIKVYSLKNDKKLIYNLPSTSELAFCLMISLLKKLVTSFDSVKKYEWQYLNFIGQELASLKVGIIGFGRLGKFMAKYCNAFGMEVFIYDKYKKSKKYKSLSINSMFTKCDVISLHVHLNSETKNLINLNLMKKAKNNLIIINTSRGDIINEKDLLIALKKKHISGYGADVLSDELKDIHKSQILKNINKHNIIITPHIGGMTAQGQKKAYEWAINKF